MAKSSMERLQMVAMGCNKAYQIPNGPSYLAQSNEMQKKLYMERIHITDTIHLFQNDCVTEYGIIQKHTSE